MTLIKKTTAITLDKIEEILNAYIKNENRRNAWTCIAEKHRTFIEIMDRKHDLAD